MSEVNETLKDLKEALPKFERMVLNGKPFEIKPFKFVQFAEALEAVAPIISFLSLGELNEITIVTAICSNAKVFVRLVKLVTNETDDFINELSPVDGIKVIKAIIRLNADFFKEEVPSLLKEMFSGSPNEQEKTTN